MKNLLRVQFFFLVFLFPILGISQKENIRLAKGAFAPNYSLPKGEILYVDGKPIVTKQKLDIYILDIAGDSINVSLQDGKEDGKEFYKSGDQMTLYTGQGNNLHVKYTDWDTSPLSIPIKIRPSIDDTPLEFVGEFTLGSYIGYQIGSKSFSDAESFHYSQTFSGFAAPTMVKINPEVANTDMSNLILGFSVGIGYIANLNDFQIGVVGGVDYISGDASQTWIYQGQPWFSFTIGFDFNDE